MHDRIEQALDLTGLDPLAETTADFHSYGFRKSRSAWNATGAVFNALRLKGSANWVLEADIKGCFDYSLTMLEPYEVKVSRTVLRGLGTGNSPRLPDSAKSRTR